MKTKFIFAILSSLLLIIGTSISTYSQRCDKQNFCDEEILGQYDYRSQSSFAVLSAGDTAKIKIVTYSGQDYNIVVCGDPSLGQIQFKILKELRKYKKKVIDVSKEEVPVYKENEYGAYETDDWGEYIQTGTEIIYDTVWEKYRVIEKKLIFDNYKESTQNWSYECMKTQTFIVQVIVPSENSGYSGCVNVMIGRRSKKAKPRFYSN